MKFVFIVGRHYEELEYSFLSTPIIDESWEAAHERITRTYKIEWGFHCIPYYSFDKVEIKEWSIPYRWLEVEKLKRFEFYV